MLRLHPQLPQIARARLAEALPRAGLPVSERHGALLAPDLASLAALPETEEAILLFDGKLLPEHAALLRRKRPAQLLACREGELPTSWELHVLRALLTGAPLLGGPAGATWNISSLAEPAQ